MSEGTTLGAYVGTFEIRGQSAGIHIVRFDASTGAIERGDIVALGNPSHLAIARESELLFAAIHSAMFEGKPGGAVVAFRIDGATGALERVNHQMMPFPHPNYIIVDRGERLVLATSGLGGGVSAFPIHNGTLAAASANLYAAGQPLLRLGETLGGISSEEFVARRALSTSPHAVMLDPSNRFAVVMDAGGDRLLVYRVECTVGTISLHQTLATKQVGSAPRHAVFHPDGHTLYVVNEASSSVTVYAFDSDEGHLGELATFAAVPAGRERGNAMGDIKIDRDGRYLYCSNRGDESIAVFAVLGKGALERIETTPCRGEHPRGLCLSPDGRFLLVANQGPTWRIDRDADCGSPDAGVVVFAIDADTGALAYTGHSVQIDSATCIVFAQ